MSILLLHGFSGHPDDLLPLEIALKQAGLSCKRPFLPGHGTHLEDLSATKAADWIKFAREQEADVVIGLSMGGLLGTILAAERPFKKLILLSPAFVLRPLGRLGVWASRLGLARVKHAFKKTVGSDIWDPVARAKSKAYPAIPLKALLEFDAIRQEALRALPHVQCPVFSFFGKHDHTVDVAAASKLVPNPVIFEHSAHILPLDYDQKELITQCLQILEK